MEGFRKLKWKNDEPIIQEYLKRIDTYGEKKSMVEEEKEDLKHKIVETKENLHEIEEDLEKILKEKKSLREKEKLADKIRDHEAENKKPAVTNFLFVPNGKGILNFVFKAQCFCYVPKHWRKVV